MADTKYYHTKGKSYLAQAHDELANDDLSQASEKGWGAAAAMVKAVAYERHWGHRSHRDLFRAVERLAAETQDSELRSQFGLAGMLHTNFYEGWLERPTVEGHLSEVRQFVERLEHLLVSR